MNNDDSTGSLVIKAILAVIGIILGIAGCVHATDIKPELARWLSDQGYSHVTINGPYYTTTFDCYKAYSYDVTAIHDDHHVILKLCNSTWGRKIYNERQA